MRDPIRLLASLKLSVILVVVLLVALAAGTMVESTQDSAAAGRLVYQAVWFRLLLAALAINTLCALIDRWPPTRQRIGFYLTHGSFLLILVGALSTEMLKTEGQLALWEGEQSETIVNPFNQAPHQLPFAVRLDDFQIDTYPGTRRPAMFRSRVTVVDPTAGSFPAVIEMNHELTWRGWSLFQSSYQMANGREMTVLSVSKDPGQTVVFVGYLFLLLGMTTVFVTRIRQAQARAHLLAAETAKHKSAAAPKTADKTHDKTADKKLPRAAALLLAAALLTGAALPAAAASAAPVPTATAPLPDASVVAAVRALPVQHDGRTMPLDTLAREACWQVTGKADGFLGADPVALTLAWAFDPEASAEQPVVRLGSGELASLVGLPAGTSHASFRQILSNPQVRALMSEARGRQQRGEPLSPVQEKATKLEERLLWMQGFFTRDSLSVVPPASGDGNGTWSALPAFVDSAPAFATWATAQRNQPPAAYPAFSVLHDEVTYNSVQPSRLAWWILLPTTLLSLGALRYRKRWLDWAATGGLVAGFAVMSWGILTRWEVAGRIPAANMYESMLFLGWGIGLFALVAALAIRHRLVIFNAAAMSALTMLLVDLLPVDPFIHPIAPVLSGTPWLAIHVPIIMVSYSVLALGVLIAHLQIGVEIFRPAKRESVERLNGLLYWYMHVGSILLAAGIITGSVWAASSWGRYWGWDPKEVWSLIAFLAYMAILHSRFDRQIGAFGVAAASIVAFWTVLMTYLGVNFVLASGLHSYGFGSGGLVSWMAGIGALEIVFLAAGYLAHRRNVAQHGPLLATV